MVADRDLKNIRDKDKKKQVEETKIITEKVYTKDTLFVNNYLDTKEFFHREIDINFLTLNELIFYADILRTYKVDDIIASMFINFSETLKEISLITEIPFKTLVNDFTDSMRQTPKTEKVEKVSLITLENLKNLNTYTLDEKRQLLKDYYRTQIKW